MRQISTQIEIDASDTKVWAVLTDFKRYPEWNPFIRKLEGRPEVGERLTAIIEPPDRKAMTFRPVVVAVRPGRELRWLGRLQLPKLFDGEHSFVIEPLGEEKSLFRHSEMFRGILVPVIWKSLAEPTQRGFESMNNAIKQRSEGSY
jgi:hypothetical protein